MDDLVSFLRVEDPIDVFVLCFKLGDVVPIRSVETRWKMIVHRNGKDLPVMMVGLKSDEFRMSSRVVGGEVASVGASASCECSALK